MRVLLAAGLVLGLVISWFITRMISRPLDEAATTMRDIASGDGDLTKTLKRKAMTKSAIWQTVSLHSSEKSGS